VSYPHHHRCKTDPRQVRRYQCEAALRWRIGRWPGLHPRPFRPAHANEDPRLSTEEVTKRGKVFRQQRIGRWSYLPLLFIFILILSSPPEDSGSEGVSSPRTLATTRAALEARPLCLRTHNRSLWTQLASHLTTSAGQVTPIWHCECT
jgi:hypothetical protein